MIAATFHYSDVAADLRARAAKLLTLAVGIEEFMLTDEPAIVAPPTTTPASRQQQTAPAGTKPKRRKSALGLGPAILAALKNGPLSPAQLKLAVSDVSGGDGHRVDKQCFAEKQRARIRKNDMGYWELWQQVASDEAEESEPEPASFTPIAPPAIVQAARNPSGPAMGLPSVADLVRQVSREPEPRTTIGMIDRVEQLIGHRAKRATISTTISAFLREGVLIRRGEDGSGAPYIRPADEATITATNGLHA